jgi:excisionase family DNA binding protein
MGKYLTLDQCADRLAVSRRTVRRLISEGRLEAVSLNARIIRVNEDDLAKALRPILPRS